DCEAVLPRHPRELTVLLEGGESPTRQVVRAEGVLEPGVGGAGVDEEGVADLANVPQPLDGCGVQREKRRMVEANVVPERISDNLEIGWVTGDHTRGPAAAAPSGASARYCAKFSRNMLASLRACAS